MICPGNSADSQHDGSADSEDQSLPESLGLDHDREFFEAEAPRRVDIELIRAFHRGELSDTLASDVRSLMLCYREWAEADRQVTLEEAANTPWDDDD